MKVYRFLILVVTVMHIVQRYMGKVCVFVCVCVCVHAHRASQVALVVKNLPASAGDIRDSGLIPGSGRFPVGGHGNPLLYSCLENPHGQKSLADYRP